MSAHRKRVGRVSSHGGSGELPGGWKWKTIPDLVGDDGVFIDGDWVESKDQDPNGDVRLIQLADVGDGVYRDKSERFMTKTKADELRCTFLKNVWRDFRWEQYPLVCERPLYRHDVP